jgi:hypothetical protein
MVLVVLLSTSLAFEETMDDLVKWDGFYYPKFSEVPFTGKVTGRGQGILKDGRKDDPWVRYHDHGQLFTKRTYKNV